MSCSDWVPIAISAMAFSFGLFNLAFIVGRAFERRAYSRQKGND